MSNNLVEFIINKIKNLMMNFGQIIQMKVVIIDI